MSIFHLFDKKIILGPALDLIRQTSQKIKTIQAHKKATLSRCLVKVQIIQNIQWLKLNVLGIRTL